MKHESGITVAQALKYANGRVNMVTWVDQQYKVNIWSPRHNAWYEGNPTNRPTALRRQYEHRISEALSALGFEDSSDIAARCADYAYPKDWRQCVRDEVKARKNTVTDS